jgi:hypothetical protein
MVRRNRWTATCASCGGRVPPHAGVQETHRGVTKVVHEDCQGPRYGTAPRPRARNVAPVTVPLSERLAVMVPARRATIGAVLAGVLVLGATAVAAGWFSDEPADDGALGVVDIVVTTSTSTSTSAPTTVPTTAAPTTVVVEVAPTVITSAPQPLTTPPPETLPPETRPPDTLGPEATAPPIQTTTVAPATTTTVAPTTTTTTEPDGRRGRDCEPDDRRKRCQDDDDD